jgi:hypothetical protein
MRNRYSRHTQKALESFDEIENDRFFGVHKRGTDLEEIFTRITRKSREIDATYPGTQVGRYWVQPLRDRESGSIPPQRVINALNLDQRRKEGKRILRVPEPVGLAYEGTLKGYLGERSKGYFVTGFVKGRKLLSALREETDEKVKQKISSKILLEVRILYDETKLVLLDFAPRDIVLVGNDQIPVFCDTEHLKTRTDYNGETKKVMVDMERQFRKDYELFLRPETINRLAEAYFKER